MKPQMSEDTKTFLAMKPGQVVSRPVVEICNVRAKLSKLHRSGMGSWITRRDRNAGLVKVVRV